MNHVVSTSYIDIWKWSCSKNISSIEYPNEMQHMTKQKIHGQSAHHFKMKVSYFCLTIIKNMPSFVFVTIKINHPLILGLHNYNISYFNKPFKNYSFES